MRGAIGAELHVTDVGERSRNGVKSMFPPEGTLEMPLRSWPFPDASIKQTLTKRDLSQALKKVSLALPKPVDWYP